LKEHDVKAQLSDLDIQECCTEQEIREVYLVMHQLRDDLDIDTFLKRVKQAQLEGYQIFCARFGKQVVGVVGLRFLHDLCWGHNLYIDDLVVDKALRGKGVGQALMRFVKDLGNSHKCQYVRLASGISKTKVHPFYEKLGYRKTSFAFALKLT
jgi:ribosomal protein S18 acetylase RimI-like enzyme